VQTTTPLLHCEIVRIDALPPSRHCEKIFHLFCLVLLSTQLFVTVVTEVPEVFLIVLIFRDVGNFGVEIVG